MTDELIEKAYYKGANEVIDRVSEWLDEDTVAELREEFSE